MNRLFINTIRAIVIIAVLYHGPKAADHIKKHIKLRKSNSARNKTKDADSGADEQ